MNAFFTLYSGLHREGPGEPADVLWAIKTCGLTGAVRVADVACGSGADTLTFAEALPEAMIDAHDQQPHFIAEATARCAKYAPRVRTTVGDMAALTGPYDLIWCAGAVYFLGIERALTLWRDALAPGGRIAFSEPVYLSNPPSPTAQAFWQGETASMTEADGIAARVASAGYRTLATRLVIGAPWQAYYDPLEQRIAALRHAGADTALEAVLKASTREIDLWRQAPQQIAYLLSVVTPED